MRVHHWIGGRAVEPASGKWLELVDPKRGAACGEVARGDAADVDAAVAAAAAAEVPNAAERADLLEAVADHCAGRLEEFAAAEARDSGKLEGAAREGDVPRALDNLRFYASLLRAQETACHATEDGLNYTLRQPLGVVATISPWNFPMHLYTWKVAPAVAMGNAVVSKPSELTPTTATMVAEAFTRVGAPDGLVNVVHGSGGEAGDALVRHDAVRAISFTGSTATGRAIAEAAAPRLKKVGLELGGKNPSVVFADCDLERTVAGVARGAFFNAGQVCLCGSRLIVERGLHDRLVAALTAEAERWQPGEGIGALVSEAQRDKVEAYVELARALGGTIACGGARGGDEGGYGYAPTVITDLPADCRPAQEEIFGPVVTVHPFDDEEEALALANGVDYGLAASLWTRDLERAHRFAARLEAGMVWINAWNRRDLRVPFGGMKGSGLGREGGRYSMEFYSQDRNVYVQL